MSQAPPVPTPRTGARGLVAVLLLAWLVSGQVMADETPRIKRISLMTADIDQSIQFFTEVIGFSLDFEGTLPPNGEPFLGTVFNIDASVPLRRALLSTSQEPRGLFLIEHPNAPSRYRITDGSRDGDTRG